MLAQFKQMSQINRIIVIQSFRYIKQTIQSPHFELIKALRFYLSEGS